MIFLKLFEFEFIVSVELTVVQIAKIKHVLGALLKGLFVFQPKRMRIGLHVLANNEDKAQEDLQRRQVFVEHLFNV